MGHINAEILHSDYEKGKEYADVRIKSSIEISNQAAESIALGTLAKDRGLGRRDMEGMFPRRYVVAVKPPWPAGWMTYLATFRDGGGDL